VGNKLLAALEKMLISGNSINVVGVWGSVWFTLKKIPVADKDTTWNTGISV
jgi:hypothetical protein